MEGEHRTGLAVTASSKACWNMSQRSEPPEKIRYVYWFFWVYGVLGMGFLEFQIGFGVHCVGSVSGEALNPKAKVRPSTTGLRVQGNARFRV